MSWDTPEVHQALRDELDSHTPVVQVVVTEHMHDPWKCMCCNAHFATLAEINVHLDDVHPHWID